MGTKIRDINKLEIGDYVVHYKYGIGRYNGLRTLKKGDLTKEYLMLEYAGTDKLYIPVEKIDLIKKYSNSDASALEHKCARSCKPGCFSSCDCNLSVIKRFKFKCVENSLTSRCLHCRNENVFVCKSV